MWSINMYDFSQIFPSRHPVSRNTLPTPPSFTPTLITYLFYSPNFRSTELGEGKEKKNSVQLESAAWHWLFLAFLNKMISIKFAQKTQATHCQRWRSKFGILHQPIINYVLFKKVMTHSPHPKEFDKECGPQGGDVWLFLRGGMEPKSHHFAAILKIVLVEKTGVLEVSSCFQRIKQLLLTIHFEYKLMEPLELRGCLIIVSLSSDNQALEF